jgi:hypothetical protein
MWILDLEGDCQNGPFNGICLEGHGNAKSNILFRVQKHTSEAAASPEQAPFMFGLRASCLPRLLPERAEHDQRQEFKDDAQEIP